MVVWSIDLVEGGRAEEAEEGGDGGGEGERSVARPRRGEELGQLGEFVLEELVAVPLEEGAALITRGEGEAIVDSTAEHAHRTEVVVDVEPMDGHRPTTQRLHRAGSAAAQCVFAVSVSVVDGVGWRREVYHGRASEDDQEEGGTDWTRDAGVRA